MGTITRRRGRFKVSVRRKGHRAIYETFDKISVARSFINKVESDIQQMKYKNISEATEISKGKTLPRQGTQFFWCKSIITIIGSQIILYFKILV